MAKYSGDGKCSSEGKGPQKTGGQGRSEGKGPQKTGGQVRSEGKGPHSFTIVYLHNGVQTVLGT